MSAPHAPLTQPSAPMDFHQAMSSAAAALKRGADGFPAEPPLVTLTREHAQVRQELERSNRVKSEFVATMSHELRTPLSIIMGYVDLLLEGEFGAVTSQQSEVLTCVAGKAIELRDMINATLRVGRAEKGEAWLDIVTVAPAALVVEATTETFDAHSKPGIGLVLDVPPDLASINTDPANLKTIVRNLVLNALKFTIEGTVTVVARVSADGLTIAVSDTGIGIAPEIAPTIYEPFRQGESTMARRFGGVGLGLYSTRQLLELLGGTIAMETEVGRGSTFTVKLPDRPLSRPDSIAVGA